MITEKELNPHGYKLEGECVINFLKLYFRINEFRHFYGKPMFSTFPNAGVRSVADQEAINPKHMKSNHLKAAAWDPSDVSGDLWRFVMNNLQFCENIGLWMESKVYTPTWVHFQIFPPKSGSRIFIP